MKIPGARLQASPVSKNVGGLLSWLAQLDSPGIALKVGVWIKPGGVKLVGQGGGCVDTTPSVRGSVH